MKRKYKLEELNMIDTLNHNCFASSITYTINYRGKVLITSTDRNAIENWLQANVELDANKVLATTTLSEAIARALRNP